jgi:hypothetical protein
MIFSPKPSAAIVFLCMADEPSNPNKRFATIPHKETATAPSTSNSLVLKK